jgi:hypothetical protein
MMEKLGAGVMKKEKSLEHDMDEKAATEKKKK